MGEQVVSTIQQGYREHCRASPSSMHAPPVAQPATASIPPIPHTLRRSTSAMYLRRMSSTCCRNMLEACCSIESPPPGAALPRPAMLMAAAAAAKLVVGAAGAADAVGAVPLPPPRLRLSSAPRSSLKAAPLERGVSVGPTADDASPVVGGTPLPPTAAIRPARGVAIDSAAMAGVAAPGAGAAKRFRTESSSPAVDRDSALCCSTLRSVTLRSYFSHCKQWIERGVKEGEAENQAKAANGREAPTAAAAAAGANGSALGGPPAMPAPQSA